MKQLVDVYTTNTLNGANGTGAYTGDRMFNLVYNAAKDDYRSAEGNPTVITIPIPLLAGDVLDMRLSVQYANDNNLANGSSHSVINGVDTITEHWSLWCMGASRLYLNETWDANGSELVMEQREENFDNFMHYYPVDRSGYWKVTHDMPANSVLWSTTYFVASKYYVWTPAIMRVIGNGYSKMQVAVFR